MNISKKKRNKINANIRKNLQKSQLIRKNAIKKKVGYVIGNGFRDN